jgi:hypothetical protein
VAGLVQPAAKLAVSMGSDENGKRYQLLINRPAQLMIRLTGLYPYYPIILLQHPCRHPITTTVQP